MGYTRSEDFDQLALDLQDRGHTYVSIAELCTETLTRHHYKYPQVHSGLVSTWLRRYLVGGQEPMSVKSRLVVRTAKAILAQPILECAVVAGDDEQPR
jgi:hypothetical protein